MNQKINGKLLLPQKSSCPKLIFFFDIDGTLVEKSGRILISNSLINIIQRLKKKNVLFGINTGRSWAQSKKIYEVFGFNGPIIVENGSAYLLNKNDKIFNIGKQFLNTRNRVRKILVQYFKKKYGVKVKFLISDNKSSLNKVTTNLLFLTSLSRHFSLSLYIREHGCINNYLIYEALNMLKSKFRKKYDNLQFQQIEREGKILVFSKKINKIQTMYMVSRRHFKSCKIVFVSDKDKLSSHYRIISFASVKNSNPSYQKHCQYIAKTGGAKGISEIINKFTCKLQ